jgi:hypothetical protein
MDFFLSTQSGLVGNPQKTLHPAQTAAFVVGTQNELFLFVCVAYFWGQGSAGTALLAEELRIS